MDTPHPVRRVVRAARGPLRLGLALPLIVASCSGPATPTDGPPTVSAVADQRTLTGAPLEVAFTVDDEAPATVTVTASSSDPALVPPDGLELSGSGADRTLRITPAPSVTGSAEITVGARDVGGNEGSIAFTLTVETPVEQALAAGDAANGDFFGWAVAIDGADLVVGAYRANLGIDGTDAGAAYVFRRSGAAWTESAKLVASDAFQDARFGSSVAIDGDRIAVGAARRGNGAGAVYVFERAGDAWTEVATLTASDAGVMDSFGISVAIDGDVIAVGASGNDLEGTLGDDEAGSAYVFERQGSGWVETARLTASDTAAFDRFGNAVAVAGDDVLVGAYRDDETGLPDAGAVYVFRRAGSSWTEVAKLTAGDAAPSDRFGGSVAAAGDLLIVGADQADTTAGADAGTAYVFRRVGSDWTEEDTLAASDAAAEERFGGSVATDGVDVVVGASWIVEGSAAATGAAYLYRYDGGAWSEVDQLEVAGRPRGDLYGSAVALGGGYALVGAYGTDIGPANGAGAAYLFPQ